MDKKGGQQMNTVWTTKQELICWLRLIDLVDLVIEGLDEEDSVLLNELGTFIFELSSCIGSEDEVRVADENINWFLVGKNC